MNLQRSITLPAASGGQPGGYWENVGRARFFICLSSSAPFKVQFGQDQATDSSTGVAAASGQSGIGRLALLNDTTSTITVTFAVSDAPLQPQPNPLSSQILVSDTQTQVNLGAGNSYTYVGNRTINGVQRQRKFLDIDMTSGGPIEVQETSTARRIGLIQANTFRRFDLSDDLTVFNPTGGSVKVTIYEVF
jgi:hypothetical protein